VQTLRLSIPDKQVPDDEKAARMQQAIRDRIAAIPGVTAVGLASNIPLDGSGWHDPIYAEDHAYAEGQLPPLRVFRFAAPGFFDTLGTPILAGRDFTWSETYDRLPSWWCPPTSPGSFGGIPGRRSASACASRRRARGARWSA
jgi:hypothetical protein